ncbi:ATP-dependent endonuclease [Catenulispora yoronensis]|uniref:ATP-dependent endonuclease n=1 Tax=Catenulispora yoronensis TaxID=450799 RepID=A0ABP5H4V2_9ACTN
MYLARLEASGFRSLRETRIDLRPEVTILVGENNGGKTNVIDAVQLLVDPLEEGRARRWWTRDDVADGCSGPVTLTGVYRELSPAESGTHLHALAPDPDWGVKRCAVYGVSYTPPPSNRRSGDRGRSAGGREGDPEPAARRMIRQVYLPPLRDAQQELSSGAGQSLKLILSSVLGDEKKIEEFEESYAKAIQAFEQEPPVTVAVDRINAPLGSLTEGARAQAMSLRFAEPKIEAIARALRARLNDEGIEAQDITRSGLGYANLLYIATVLTELEAAQEADLTVLLVEEPEAHLHPQLQSLLLKLLYDRAAKQPSGPGADPGRPSGRIQVLITTHSPVLAAAAPVADLVVLHARDEPSPAQQVDDGVQRSEDDDQDVPVQAAPRAYRTTAVIPVAALNLSAQEKAKLSRYLDVTKSAMLFGPRVILVEGTAETLLLPPFAEIAVREWRPAGDKRHVARLRGAARSTFRGTPIVSVDGVDFKPFLKILLSGHGGERIAEKVLVITDRDPKRRDGDGTATRGGYNRKDSLTAYLRDDVEAPDGSYLIVEGDPTLEPQLVHSENLALLEKVFAELRPGSAHRWEKVAQADADLQPLVFGELFGPYAEGSNGVDLPKGEYAYRLSALLADPAQNFVVPPYLAEGLRWIMAIGGSHGV